MLYYHNHLFSTFGSCDDAEMQQVAQLSQRDRAAGWVSSGQKWKTEIKRQYVADIIGLYSTTVT